MTPSLVDQMTEAMPWLDRTSAVLKTIYKPAVGETAPPGVKDALAGTWLGHPLHPAVVVAPIGFWTSSLILDLTGEWRAADLTLVAGLLSAGGAALTGAAQYYDATTNQQPRRLGALHALVNTVAMGLYGASWWQRRRGNRGRGQALAMAGYGVLNAGGYLGGHLTYVLGIGVDHAAFEAPPEEWTDVCAVDELQFGKPKRVELDDSAVMLLAREDGVHAIGAICPHLGGPLDEGEIEGDTVSCPWHGSVFCISDGSLQHGPATTPAKVYDVRIDRGRVSVRAAHGPNAPLKAKPIARAPSQPQETPPPPSVDRWMDAIASDA